MSEPRPRPGQYRPSASGRDRPGQRTGGAGVRSAPSSSRRAGGGPAPGNRARPATDRRDPRRDPGPSRLGLALHRLLTTPMGRGSTSLRINLLVLVIAAAVVVSALRLVHIQGLDPQAYANQAHTLVERSQPLPAQRGTITDRNGQVLAESSPAVDVTADPEVTAENADLIASVLAKHLGGTPEEYLEPLTRPDTRYAMIRRQVPAHTYDLIRSELAAAGDEGTYVGGIWTSTNSIRTYPAGSVAANLVGVLRQDEDGVYRTGAYGFEYARNASLGGTDGTEVYQASPAGTKIPLGANEITPAQDGTSYQLTIDAELQWAAEQAVRRAVVGAEAESGYAIVMNVRTGEVLSMAQYPSFDASDLTTARAQDMDNKAISAALEPGSVQKVLTMAALVDRGYATPDTQVFVPSQLASADLTITDSSAHGDLQLTASGVLAQSSNIGTALLAREMPKAELVAELQEYGLGARTGIELPAEATGWAPAADMPDYSRDQVAFGQGLSVTGIQMAAAVAGILNDGIYNPPTVIRSATSPEGQPVVVERQEPRRIVSPQASAMVTEMMEAVTGPHGTGRQMALEEYRSVGKTATAERYDEATGRYAGYTASYIGAAPAEDPQILTYVVVDKPVKGHYGSTVAGPAYSEIMAYALPRYGVLPSVGEAPEIELEW